MVQNDTTIGAADEDESNFERTQDDDGMVETTPSGDVVDDDLVTTDDAGGGDDDGWFDAGVITLTLLAGIALFLFPEPLTSGIGVLLMGVGVIAWIVDWLG